MDAERSVRLLIEAFEAEAVDYMLTGALATNVYGIPRSTKDADVVVDLASKPNGLEAVMRRLGESFQLQAQASFEILTGSTRYIIEISGTAFQIELFLVTDDPHMKERFRRKLRVDYQPWNRAVWLPTAEDVVVQKLRWARPKDLEDVRDVIAVQRDTLDWNYISTWCERHQTQKRMQDIVASIPDTA